MSLVNSGITLIRKGGEGGGRERYPGKVLFVQLVFANNECDECVVASVLFWQLSQLILSPTEGYIGGPYFT